MPDYTIPNLRNACRILDCLAEAAEPLSSAELADRLGIPRSTALRILYTLEAQQYIRKEGRQIVLGSALIRLGINAQTRLSIREIARPILQKLTESTLETSHLAVLTADKALILEVFDSPHPLSAHSRQGTAADLHCSATGKALLAYMEREQRETLLENMEYNIRTPHTLRTKEALLEELEAIRKQGFSIDEQEYHNGIRCVAAPVFDAKGVTAYAIGITASMSRFTRAKIKPYAKTVIGLADDLTHALGGQRPKH